jgi:hypothetical protein
MESSAADTKDTQSLMILLIKMEPLLSTVMSALGAPVTIAFELTATL